MDELKAVTKSAVRHNLIVEMTDTAVGRGAHSALMLGGDGRAREIEAFQQTIRSCARAGIPSLKYYLSILPILRLDEVPGRADTRYWRWNYRMASTPDGEARMTLGPTRTNCASSAKTIRASTPICSGNG